MERVFIAIGSNLGDRLVFLQSAVHKLQRIPGLDLRSVSPVYETEPVGNKNQPHFLNAVVEFATTLTAEGLLTNLKEVERLVGRTPSERWGPREIDLDLIYANGLVINTPQLVVPHPELDRRKFVLVPLADIAADFQDPLRKRTVRDLLRDCPDTSSLSKTSFTIKPNPAER